MCVCTRAPTLIVEYFSVLVWVLKTLSGLCSYLILIMTEMVTTTPFYRWGNKLEEFVT